MSKYKYKLKEVSTTGGEGYSTPFAFKRTKKQKPIIETDIESLLKDTNVTDGDLKKWISTRLLAFDKIEDKLNELVPLIQQAKHKTIDIYRQTPNYDVIYGTDLAIDYLDDLIQLFKD